jgi:hypothetical protein
MARRKRKHGLRGVGRDLQKIPLRIVAARQGFCSTTYAVNDVTNQTETTGIRPIFLCYQFARVPIAAAIIFTERELELLGRLGWMQDRYQLAVAIRQGQEVVGRLVIDG